MIANNVVNFPKAYIGPKEKVSAEDITRNLDMMKQFHIQETIANLAPLIFNHLDVSGFALLEEEAEEAQSIKDGAFVIEALRAIMCKHYGIYHPFQKLSEEIFYADEDEPEALRIVDSLNIVLKEDNET